MMKRVIISGVLIVAIILSVFVISPRMSKPETYQTTIKKLNEKQTTVLEMTAAASGASLALGAVPGDATTPIANKVIDMAGYFVIILSVIILEKYFLTIGGYLAFTWILPIAMGLFIISLYWKKGIFHHLAIKLLLLGVAIITIVPLSVKVTEIVEKTNEASINSTMENFKEIQKEVEETTEVETPDLSTEEKESTGPLDFISGMKEKMDDVVEDTRQKLEETANSITQLSQEAIQKAKDVMNDFVEIVVIMLVTTCGIPILTLVFMVWIVKTLLGLDLVMLRQGEYARIPWKMSGRRPELPAKKDGE